MDNDTLDYLARRLGLLYDESLRTDRDCMKVSCSMRKEDGTCTCTDKIRDVIDMVWEAKAGRPERLDEFIAKVMYEEGEEFTAI